MEIERSTKASSKSAPQSTALLWAPFLAALFAYAQTLANGFVWDDLVYIAQNPAVHGFGRLPEALGKGFGWVPGVNEAANSSLLYYRPAIVAMNAIQWTLSGGKPWAFHLLNVLAHALSAAALSALIARIGLNRRTALIAGIAFALHPAYSEAVAWVSARTDLLATFCGLMCLLTLARRPNRPVNESSNQSAIRTGVWFFLAACSKESAVLPIFVAAWMLTIFTPRAQGRGRIALLVAGALYAGLRVLALRSHSFGAGSRHEHAPFLTRVLQSGTLYAQHLWRMVAPWPSSTEPPSYVTPEHLSMPMAIAGLALLLGSVAALYVVLRRAQGRVEPRDIALALGLSIFLGGLIPVLQWVPTGDLYGERFLYLPAIGFFIAVGALSDRWMSRGARAWIAIAICAAPWLWILETRLPEWKDEISLFSASVRVSPESARANAVLGAALMNAGKLAESEPYLKRGLELDPKDTTKHAQVGSLLLKLGKVDDGVKELEQAYDGGLHSITVLTNLGVGRIYQGRGEDATAVLNEALALQPDSIVLKEVLALARDKAGDHEDAAAKLTEVINLDPNRKSAYLSLIDVYRMGLKQTDKANEWSERFLARFPTAPEAERVRSLISGN